MLIDRSNNTHSQRRLWGLLLVCGVALLLSAMTALAQFVSSRTAMPQESNYSRLESCVLPPPQAIGYRLAFSTNFSPLNLSPNSVGSYNWYNPGIWWESSSPYGNIHMLNSALDLVWTNGQTNADTSISTAAQDGSYYQAWHYGYFEVRMRWDTVNGAWPAIWMIPIEDILTPGQQEEGELDIFEGQGNTPDIFYGTVHDWKNGQDVNNNDCCNAYQLPGRVDLSQYHTYGVLWTPGHVSWFLDNRLLNSVETYPIFDDVRQKYYLILGSQEGVDWTAGDTSGVTATSISMQVQWVHVWQREWPGCIAAF